jgi:hypothetical protein
MDDTKNIHISTRFTTKEPIYLNENSKKSQDCDENIKPIVNLQDNY